MNKNITSCGQELHFFGNCLSMNKRLYIIFFFNLSQNLKSVTPLVMHYSHFFNMCKIWVNIWLYKKFSQLGTLLD